MMDAREVALVVFGSLLLNGKVKHNVYVSNLDVNRGVR